MAEFTQKCRKLLSLVPGSQNVTRTENLFQILIDRFAKGAGRRSRRSSYRFQSRKLYKKWEFSRTGFQKCLQFEKQNSFQTSQSENTSEQIFSFLCIFQGPFTFTNCQEQQIHLQSKYSDEFPNNTIREKPRMIRNSRMIVNLTLKVGKICRQRVRQPGTAVVFEQAKFQKFQQIPPLGKFVYMSVNGIRYK